MTDPQEPDGVEDNRARARQRRRETTADAQDIAKKIATKPAKPKRRKKAEASLEYFAKTYFPERFDKPFGDDHLITIAQIEAVVISGGKVAIAMPRGSGKTTLTVVACIWALLTGRRQFIALIGADKDAAIELLNSLKVELASNPLLLEDFPLECGPIALLEGEARRCKGQSYEGKQTHVELKTDRLVFATIPGSKAPGSIIRAKGLTGGLRGMQFTRADGKVLRPDLAVADDPQTDQSAHSAGQTDYREKLITKAIRGLAGPGKKISIIMPCTLTTSA